MADAIMNNEFIRNRRHLYYPLENYVGSIKVLMYSNRRQQMEQREMGDIGSGANFLNMEHKEMMTMARDNSEEAQKAKKFDAIDVENSLGERIGVLRNELTNWKLKQNLENGTSGQLVSQYLIDSYGQRGGLPAHFNLCCFKDNWTAERVDVWINVFMNTRSNYLSVDKFQSQIEKYKDKLAINFEISDKYEEIVSAYELAAQIDFVKIYRANEHHHNIEDPFKKIKPDEVNKITVQPEGIKTQLKPHQLQALNWMRGKENSEKTPIFWKKVPMKYFRESRSISEKSKLENTYANLISRTHCKGMPRTVKGGLFCDDMGLGKTLCVIALIMSNDKNNKSLTASAYDNLISSETREKAVNEAWGISSGDSEDELNRTVESMSIQKRKNIRKDRQKNESSDDSYTEDDNTQDSYDSEKENICRPVRSSKSKGRHPFFAEKSYPKRKKAIIESDSESETLTSEEEICSTQQRETQKKIITSSTDSDELSILEDDDYKPIKTSQKGTKSKQVIFSDTSSDASIKIDRSKKNTKNTGQNKSITSSSNSSPRKRKKIDSDSDDCSITSVSRTNSVTPRVKRKKKSVLRGSQSTNSQPSQNVESPTEQMSELSEPLITFSVNLLEAAKTMNPEISPSKVQMKPGYHSGLNTTLIVVPLSVISNWEEQVKEHCSKTLSVQTFHGESTKVSIISLTQKDIVITTYGTLTSLYDKMLKRGERSIFQIHFLRVILDEAHQIRNMKTLRCDACVGISSERKWFVTGTPMQNRVNDVFTSLRFLQIEPLQHNTFFQEYIGRGFEAEMVDERKQYCAKNVRSLLSNLMMRRNKDDKQSDGTPLVKLPLKTIYEFRTNFNPVEDEMYQRLAKLCTKQLRESVENDARNMGLMRAIRKNQLHIFAIIRKLRNMCLGIEIVDEATRNALKCYTSEDYNKKMLLESQANAESDWNRLKHRDKVCSRCEKSMANCKREEIRYSRTCGHFFCDKCCYVEPKKVLKNPAKEEMGEEEDLPCEEHPDGSCQDQHHQEKNSYDEYAELCTDYDWLCNTCNKIVTIKLDIEKLAVSKDDIVDQLEAIQEKALKKKMDKVPLEDLKSSKVKALIGLIEEHFTSENPGKLVVATQSVQFIYLLKRVFREDKTLENRDFYNTFMLHGSMQNAERASVISKFSTPVEEEEGKRVILFLSITCGGVGINLKAANAIIICDPSYNPATEAQCVDRIYRMGQNRGVKVTKLVIRGSIENRMLNIQKQKGANIALAIEDVEEEEVDTVGEKMAQLMDLYNVLTTGKDRSDEHYDDLIEIYNSVDGVITYHKDQDTDDF